MSYRRDTDIGYSTQEDTVSTILTRLETLLNTGITTTPESPSGRDLDTLIDELDNSVKELRLIRRGTELTLGQEIDLPEESE